MKSFFLVISFLIFAINGVYSQEDSLSTSSESGKVQTPQKDSVFLVVLPPDSVLWGRREPKPDCIFSMKWDAFDISKFLDFNQIIAGFYSHYNKAGALQDIKKHEMQILFSGGLGGMPDFSSAEDRIFQKRYGVVFHSQGCIHSGEGENEAEYNQTIFAYLDKTYGPKWRYELRSDAIGFEAPPEIPDFKELTTTAALLVPESNNNDGKTSANYSNPEDSIWWYIMPTSGFALLLALYFVKRRKK